MAVIRWQACPAPARRTGSRKPTYQCMPLQNGLFCE
jgi:hypothetical protein